MNNNSAGEKLRLAVQQNNPLQVVGTINAYSAIMAEKSGHKAIYLSGGGVAASSLGTPDLGITTLADVLEDARRITDASSLPLLVDVDVGWGGAFNIARCVREMIRADVAGVHIEDQVMQKRCGHRPNKAIVAQAEMVDRVKAAVDARSDEDFVIMARTDALAVEGIESAIDRAIACVDAGADMIFPEAMTTLEQYQQFVDAVKVPVLANITEFGATPLFSTEELASVGVKLALYPLSAFRAMSLAALKVYQTILNDGSQQNAVETMQTRMELYDFLDYHQYEQTLDQLFKEEK
ncbi:MAG: methylisocitrate lyase [Planctomycetota bacterium]|jgi:methylisocitrate lyase